MEIAVNGVRRMIAWGSTLGSITSSEQHVELLRLYQGQLAPVTLDRLDSNTLRLPLLPGDQVKTK
jgi:hypothetical protein